MALYKAPSADTQVLSDGIRPILEGLKLMGPSALRILVDHGIDPAMPTGHWFSQQHLLSALRTIFHTVGPATVHAIGRRVPTEVPWPPGVQTLAEALGTVDAAYRLNHRGAGDIGHYAVRPQAERDVVMDCDTPYPCEFDHGIIEGVCERFRPPNGQRILVVHEPGPCRTRGDERCRYRVTW